MTNRDQDNTEKQESLDEFWDIDSLLPKKSRPAPAPRPSRRVEPTEIEFDPPSTDASDGMGGAAIPPPDRSTSPNRPQPKKSEPPQPELQYEPDHPLIRQVRIYPWRNDFRFYERFCAMADQLYTHRGQPCDPVPFFSYMPQYDQMNRAQLSWYLYWREQVRAGHYPDTDYSYIFLYLFEIINLPDRVPPAAGQRMMCDIWKHYRRVYPLLNRYLSDWICDYSLLHQLPPPAIPLGDVLPVIAEQSTFREFYACPTGQDTAGDAQIYLTFSTNYDYRKSKLYLAGPESAAAMDRHIPAAISASLEALSPDHKAFAGTKMQKATLSRDSFIGALCSGRMKRRIEVDYCSFQRSHELRFFMTDIIKYTENKLRAQFGMKSRLSIYGLPDDTKKVIKDYLRSAYPSARRGESCSALVRPAYEALYDLPAGELSFENAQKIEQTSWGVTKQLVEAFEGPTEPELPPTVQTPASTPITPVPPPEVSENDTPWAPYKAFLAAVARGDRSGQTAAAKTAGKLPDALCEEINTLASELFGDILLERGDNGGYSVIEDYQDEFADILNQLQGKE